MEAGVVGAGHSFAGSRLDAQRSVAGWVSEQMGGISYLDFVRGLVGRVEADWEGVQADLEAIRCGLLVGCVGGQQPAVQHRGARAMTNWLLLSNVGLTTRLPLHPSPHLPCLVQEGAAAAEGRAGQHDSR